MCNFLSLKRGVDGLCQRCLRNSDAGQCQKQGFEMGHGKWFGMVGVQGIIKTFTGLVNLDRVKNQCKLTDFPQIFTKFKHCDRRFK